MTTSSTSGASSAASDKANGRGPGRPRRFDDDVEAELIMDAGMRVMRANGVADASVSDILAEAKVSSRAFYRHYPSKDALLLALFTRDSIRSLEQIEEAADRAPTPTDAIYAWLDCYLDIFFEPRRAERAALMSSEAARRAEGYATVLEESEERLCLPLARALRQGNESGELRCPDPEFDAYAILMVCSSASGATRLSKTTNDRAQARSYVLRFISPAIGLAPRP